jgi:hypothetical protein
MKYHLPLSRKVVPIDAVQLCGYHNRQYRGGAANISRDRDEFLRHGRMVFCQSFKACADITKLINFVQDSFKRHNCAPFAGAKRRKTSDELLSSEDLKEEKVVTTSLPSIHPGKRARGPSGRSGD